MALFTSISQLGNEQNPPSKNNTKLKCEIAIKISQHSEYKHDTGNSTDDNLTEIIHDSDEDILTLEAKEHYDNLSDSHQSPIDDEEEEKMEQEITNRLSHLKINRDISDDCNNNHNNPVKFEPYHSNKAKDWNVDWNQDWNDRTNDIIDGNDDDMIEVYDAEDIGIDVGDEHYQSLYEKHTTIKNTNNNRYKFSMKREFLSETFLKYVMFFGTIYLISKQSLKKFYNSKSRNIDIDNIAQKMILISNAIISIFKNHEIWNKSHKAMLSPFKDLLNENERNFMDIEKAFYCVMLFLSYFNGKTISRNKRISRLYNLLCIVCIILIKKYRKLGGLYIYTSYWSELSSLFLNSSKILKWFGNRNGYYSRLMKNGGKTSAIVFALSMIYSRIYLFSKVMIPIIQHYYRNTNQYIGSIVSVAFLIAGYYKTGDGIINTFSQ